MAERPSRSISRLRSSLTEEERRVLELVIAGKSTAEIADNLEADADTIWQRLQAALTKLLGHYVSH